MGITTQNFEKIWLDLKNCVYYDNANCAIANCPNNWNFCSFIIHVWGKNLDKFIALQMNKEETIKIRDALTKVVDDMGRTIS